MRSPEITLTGQIQASKPPLEPPPPCSPKMAPHSPGTENGLAASILRTMRIGLEESGKFGTGARGGSVAAKAFMAVRAAAANKAWGDPERRSPREMRRNRQLIGTKVSSRETSCREWQMEGRGRPIRGSPRVILVGRRQDRLPHARARPQCRER